MRDLLNAAINVAQVRKYMRLERFSEYRFIECYTTFFTIIQLKPIFLLQGCMYLEENHFIHRDIAAR